MAAPSPHLLALFVPLVTSTFLSLVSWESLVLSASMTPSSSTSRSFSSLGGSFVFVFFHLLSVFPLNAFLCFSVLTKRFYSVPHALLLLPRKAHYSWVQDSQIPFVSSPRSEVPSLCCGPDEEVVVMAEAGVAQCQALVLALRDFTKRVSISFLYLCSSLVYSPLSQKLFDKTWRQGCCDFADLPCHLAG